MKIPTLHQLLSTAKLQTTHSVGPPTWGMRRMTREISITPGHDQAVAPSDEPSMQHHRNTLRGWEPERRPYPYVVVDSHVNIDDSIRKRIQDTLPYKPTTCEDRQPRRKLRKRHESVV